MDLDLKGKRLLVTGGSSGIGQALVEQATQAGAVVLFTYNSGGDKAKELAERTNSGCHQLALGFRESAEDLLLALTSASALDYVILNAGTEFSGNLGKHTFEKIEEVVRANLIGNLYLLRGLIGDKLVAPGGQISVVGSIAADGNHDQLAYSASKAGLRGAVESLSRYDAMVKEQGLGIKLLEPAFVRTRMTERLLPILERKVIFRKGGDALVQQFRDSHAVMEPAYAAEQILALTVDPAVTGIRTIPEGINLHKVRQTYLPS